MGHTCQIRRLVSWVCAAPIDSELGRRYRCFAHEERHENLVRQTGEDAGPEESYVTHLYLYSVSYRGLPR